MHPGEGGRNQADHAGESMKLLSASYQLASTFSEKATGKKSTVEMGDVTIPDTLLVYSANDALDNHLAAEVET